ncbi:MAG: Abi family protein [Chromatiaceae bacterium]|nr:Abi family protein [Chromatiaceae bacterium]MCF7993878.1 Abi family protein [Chromatiaceae bacterium]MCF8014515.1 Abi family protein [Chromatiaceae bacterium]
MAYSKPWQSYSEQLDLLISRGLVVTDRPKALEYLQRIGYYRLSGYWFPFRERSGLLILLDEHGRKPVKKQRKETRIALDDFRPGATFEDAVKLYVFDKKLRMLVMDALERIEIALRVDGLSGPILRQCLLADQVLLVQAQRNEAFKRSPDRADSPRC